MTSQVGMTAKQMQEFNARIPPDTITLQGGRVVKIENYFNWNYQDVGGSTYERTEDGVSVFHYDPEHGGPGPRVVPVSEIRDDNIRNAFAADTVDQAELSKTFPGYQIVVR